MKNIPATLVLSSLLFGAPAFAGTGHDHGHSHAQAPATKETAEKNAKQAVISLVKSKKLDESWMSAIASGSEKKVFSGHPEWVVSFVNEKEADTEKQKLYVFLSLEGEYIAANYTGK